MSAGTPFPCHPQAHADNRLLSRPCSRHQPPYGTPYHFISDLVTYLPPSPLVTDFSITGLTLLKLEGHNGKSFSSNTDDILRRIRKMTVEAALPPAICALLNMSFYLGTVSIPACSPILRGLRMAIASETKDRRSHLVSINIGNQESGLYFLRNSDA